MSRPQYFSRENGCKHHPDCFVCPEPDCIANETFHTLAANHKQEREERVGALKRQGKTASDIAKEIGAPVSTIRKDIVRINRREGVRA